MYRKAAIIDRREMLRVKVKSLAEEARIIRTEERKTHGQLREELYLHRIRDVRSHARSACLALGFTKGRTYAAMEPHVIGGRPDWAEVKRLVAKYGPKGYEFAKSDATGEPSMLVPSPIVVPKAAEEPVAA